MSSTPTISSNEEDQLPLDWCVPKLGDQESKTEITRGIDANNQSSKNLENIRYSNGSDIICQCYNMQNQKKYLHTISFLQLGNIF